MTSTDNRTKQLSPIAQGQIVAGRFLVKRFLGEGGMGKVYVAEQQPMGRKVALKVMRADLSDSQQAVKRFFREAVAVSKLTHPNTVTLFDYGESEDGSLFIAMEFLDGLSMKDVLTHEGSLSVDRVARIGAQVCLSLAEAHRKGIIHRDLKPDNIFITDVEGQRDFVKVIDFGIAHLLETRPESRITQAGFVCGTPEYMSPEQARGEELDGRCDLYSLGIILFEALENRLPYKGGTPLATVLKHQNEPVPAISTDYPKSLGDFVRRLMAKERDGRPQNAEAALAEMQEALPKGLSLPLLQVQPTPKPTHTVPAIARASESPDTEEIAKTLFDGGLMGYRRLRTLGLLLLLAGLIVVSALLLGHEEGRSTDGTPEQVGLAVPTNEPALEDGAHEARQPTPVTPPSEAATVTVGVHTRPPDAGVHIDNRYIGLSPIDLDLPAGGSVTLRIRLDGFEEHQSTIEVTPDLEGTALEIDLVRASAAVTFSSTPDGAEVVDMATGQSLGMTELTHRFVQSNEPLTLEFRLADHESQQREIVPNREALDPIHVDLEPIRHRSSRTRDRSHEPEEQVEQPTEETSESPFGLVD